MISSGCCGWADMAVIRWDHRVRRSAARASRKLGVALRVYQGRGIQVQPVGWACRYQHQIRACSHRARHAARSGPWRFQARTAGPGRGGAA